MFFKRSNLPITALSTSATIFFFTGREKKRRKRVGVFFEVAR